MYKEQIEHISIIIETIAFFLVTIDLYGRERLESMREKILVRTARLPNDPVWNFRRKIFKNSIALLSFLLLIFFYINLQKIKPEWDLPDGGSRNLNTKFVSWTLGGIALLIANATEKVALIVISGLIKILKLFRADGIMVVVGAILFLLSKLIQYYLI